MNSKISDASRKSQLEISEKIVGSILSLIGPEKFSIVLNNVCVHGMIFENSGYDISDDEVLKEWYQGIDLLKSASKKIEKINYHREIKKPLPKRKNH